MGKGQKWFYDGADASAAVAAVNFITNALNLGMKVGDRVEARNSATGIITSHVVLAVVAAGADLSDGTVIGSATNT